MSYTPIQCHLYDYIEIACLHHYTLKIHFVNGEQIIAKAITTRIRDKEEFLVVETHENKIEKEIRLDKVNKITALDDNTEFETVEINKRG